MTPPPGVSRLTRSGWATGDNRERPPALFATALLAPSGCFDLALKGVCQRLFAPEMSEVEGSRSRALPAD
jgi:hypothetical protein